IVLAHNGSISVGGDVMANAGNGGAPGQWGVAGLNGPDGYTDVYFGLSLVADFNFNSSSLGGPNFGLGGLITIYNFTLGAMAFTDPLSILQDAEMPVSG